MYVEGLTARPKSTKGSYWNKVYSSKDQSDFKVSLERLRTGIITIIKGKK